MCMGVFAWSCICALCACKAHGGQKQTSDALRLALQTFAICLVGAKIKLWFSIRVASALLSSTPKSSVLNP